MLKGGILFWMQCQPTTALAARELGFIDALVNLSMFADEAAENKSPPIDIHAPGEREKYTAILVKTMYLVRAWQAREFTAELVASLEYQKSCQPGKPSFKDEVAPGQIRFTKSVIPFVYSITVQMNVSQVQSAAALATLSRLLGFRVDRAVLLERTKRNVNYTDSTAKCKSVLLYHNVADGSGVLLTHCTVVLNTSIPSLAAKVVTGSSSFAKKEARDTAIMTRRYLASLKNKSKK